MNGKEDIPVRIGKVDCTQENDLCSKHGVTGYPTLNFFKIDAAEPVKFRGTRDLPSLYNFINEQLEVNLKPVRSNWILFTINSILLLSYDFD